MRPPCPCCLWKSACPSRRQSGSARRPGLPAPATTRCGFKNPIRKVPRGPHPPCRSWQRQKHPDHEAAESSMRAGSDRGHMCNRLHTPATRCSHGACRSCSSRPAQTRGGCWHILLEEYVTARSRDYCRGFLTVYPCAYSSRSMSKRSRGGSASQLHFTGDSGATEVGGSN